MKQNGKMTEHPESNKCLRIMWRSCNLCMCLFFSLASYVQINDPDAGLWMLVVMSECSCIGATGGIAKLGCLYNSCRFMLIDKPQSTHNSALKDACLAETSLWRRIADLHTLISAAVASMLGWVLYQKRIKDVFQQEEGREFSGLVLTMVWLLLCRHSGRNPIGALRVCTATAISVFPFLAWMYYYINKDLRSTWPSHCKTAI